MHDHHAVEELIRRLSCLEDVAEVRIRVGPGSSPEALAQAYEILTAGTALEGSRLIVEERRVERTCSACGRTWDVAPEDVLGHVVLCPTCGQASPLGDVAAIEVVGVTWGRR